MEREVVERRQPATRPARSGGEGESREPALALQHAAGNRATRALIQPKLEVGAAHDPLEREADQVASTVVERLRDPGADVDPVGITPAVGGQAARDFDAGAGDAGIGLDGGAVEGDLERAITAPTGGKSLPSGVREQIEPTLGADLRGVRIHADAAADSAAAGLQARAFTRGRDIFFRRGEYDPTSSKGVELLAHELTHVVQQGTGSAGAQRKIQRMPSLVAVRKKTGKQAKKGVSLFGKTLGATKSYNTLLDAIKAHSDYIVSTTIGENPRKVLAQISEIGRLVDGVVAAAQAYIDDKGKDAEPEVLSLCNELIANAPLEKKVALDVGTHWSKMKALAGNPKWFTQLPEDPNKHRFRIADTQPTKVTEVGGSDKGNNKSVAKVKDSSGKEGFFAEDDMSGKYEGDEFTNAKWLLNNYGVKGDDIKLGNRSIAMSRLDKLLGAGVIARTERGLKGDKMGTFQWKADGKSAKEALDGSDLKKEPELARLLSRLHLIDLLAAQVDRHEGNYFIKRDESGKIVGVTGIDLDMSFVSGGGRFDVDVTKGSTMAKDGGATDWLPGASRYVDEELANRILALDPDDLRTILMDLLEPADVEAAVRRLEALKAHLEPLKKAGKLLKPKDWTEQILAEVIDESRQAKAFSGRGGKSYFGRVAVNQGG